MTCPATPKNRADLSAEEIEKIIRESPHRCHALIAREIGVPVNTVRNIVALHRKNPFTFMNIHENLTER